MSSKPSEQKGNGKICVFCDRGDNNEDVYGKLLTKLGLTAHYFCMLFASGLSQNGKSEKEGILGFLPDDIRNELRRATRLKCSFCKRGGTTIGCVVRNCKKMFHLGCGRENHTLHQFYDTFRSYCSCHRPTQDVPRDPDPALVCSICMNIVPGEVSVNTLRAPCCRKYWYHRDCIQRYATSAGLYFFKCPLCNNKEEFQNEMLQYGIYIPDQDASWETEPHAFQELLERYDNCDAKTCKCAEGRKHDVDDTKWEIILCEFCGSSGSHVACGHLVKLGKRNVCPECFELDIKLKGSEPEYKTPPRKGSPKMPVLDPVTSPESPKGTSPYPGPSGSFKKKRLASKAKSPAALSPVLKTSSPCESAKQPKARNRKRYASPALASPPKLKKVCPGTAGETDTVLGDSGVSSSTALHSSPTSSEGDIPLAWKKIEEERKQKKLKIKKYKTKRIKSDTNGQTKTIKSYTKGQTKSIKSEANGQFSESSAVNGSSADSIKTGVQKSTKLKLKSKISRRNSTPGNGFQTESSTKKEEKKMSLTTPLVISDKIFRPGPVTKTKRKSLAADKKQTVLTNWFTQVQQKSKETTPKKKAGVVKLQPNEVKPKKPVLIEWKGKQLLIHSPKVVLKRNERFNLFKPRNLNIDMNDRKGCLDSNKEISMLASLDSDVRLTRKRLDMEVQECADWTEIPVLSKPKSLEMDKTGNKGPFEKEVELLASLDMEKRITRNMLDSEMPTPPPSCSSEAKMSGQNTKLKRKKQKVSCKEPSLLPITDTHNANNSEKSNGALEKVAEGVLDKNVDLAQKIDTVFVPAVTFYSSKEQILKSSSAEKNKLNLSCYTENTRTVRSSIARKKLDEPMKTLALPHTPPAKKSAQFVYLERSKSDPKKESILISKSNTFLLPKTFSFIHDSPPKYIRIRKAPEAITDSSLTEQLNKTDEHKIMPNGDTSDGKTKQTPIDPPTNMNKSKDMPVRESPSKNLRLRKATEVIIDSSLTEQLNKTDVKIKTEVTTSEYETVAIGETSSTRPKQASIEPPTNKNKSLEMPVRDSPAKLTNEHGIKATEDTSGGIPKQNVIEPTTQKAKSQEMPVRDSPAKNLRKKPHISYCELPTPRLTKRQENMTGFHIKLNENDLQQKMTVQWYCEGTRQIDPVLFDLPHQTENICPNIQASETQNATIRLKMPLESLEQKQKCIPYSSVSLSPESDGGDQNSDCSTAMNLSPSYFTKFRRTYSKASDNSETSTSSEAEENSGFDEVPREFSARRHIKALSDLHARYMRSLSPDRFILDL